MNSPSNQSNRASTSIIPTESASVLHKFRKRSQSISKPEVSEWVQVIDPPDGGWGWIIVVSSLINNFVLDGVAFSYSVMYDSVSEANSDISLFWFHTCGSIMLSLTLLVGPIVSLLIPRFGFRAISIAGSVISSMGFFLAWGASPNSPWLPALIIGFGIMSGIGFGMMFTTSIVIVGLYFEENRPLATGIAVAGSAVGSVAMPFIIQGGVDIAGWQGALVTLGLSCLATIPFGATYKPVPMKLIKNFSHDLGLEPLIKESSITQIMKLLSSPTYILIAISGFVTVLGYFVPSAFLLDRAKEELGINGTATIVLPATIGASNTIGRVIFGLLANSDRAVYSLALTNGALTIGGLATAASVLLTEYYQLVLYSILFGQVLAVYGTLRSIVIMELVGDERFSMGFGLSLMFMGVAALVGNPLAGWLKDYTGEYTVPFITFGMFIFLSGVMGYPLRYLKDKEKATLRKSSRAHRRLSSLAVHQSGNTSVNTHKNSLGSIKEV